MQIVDAQTRRVLLPQVEVANNAWSRFRGLMLRKEFPDNYGLWIEPCSSIHTMWMRVAIDVYFISPQGRIVDFREQVKPWTVALPKEKSRSVLEIVNPSIQLVVGSLIQLQDSP